MSKKAPLCPKCKTRPRALAPSGYYAYCGGCKANMKRRDYPTRAKIREMADSYRPKEGR